MAITVNTLGEVPEGSGYIVEVGLEGTNHPANQIDRDRIRDELGIGEWYVRTGNRTEEQQLTEQIEEHVSHTRLPAYLILPIHPEEADEAVVVHLDNVESERLAWEILQIAISNMRELSEKSDPRASSLANQISTDDSLKVLSVGANIITVIQFVA
ncbi:hypothetical protein [Haloarchaeobius litoreus]|uniref:Uncharacterized protein n=1 Tax=Haloarchaeobius litoreus TaxID=755306 RepID=A0ABD6DHR1_9EURY|nr:hypothetical protein [Haloarchaeobius litoreus]